MERQPTSVRDMTDEEFADFTEQMYWAVVEETFVWELAGGSLDLIGANTWTVHGPWRQEDCAAALSVWFDGGLVSFVAAGSPVDQPLDERAARVLLASPTAWVRRSDGSTDIELLTTEEGEASSREDWISRLASLRIGVRS